MILNTSKCVVYIYIYQRYAKYIIVLRSYTTIKTRIKLLSFNLLRLTYPEILSFYNYNEIDRDLKRSQRSKFWHQSSLNDLIIACP